MDITKELAVLVKIKPVFDKMEFFENEKVSNFNTTMIDILWNYVFILQATKDLQLYIDIMNKLIDRIQTGSPTFVNYIIESLQMLPVS